MSPGRRQLLPYHPHNKFLNELAKPHGLLRRFYYGRPVREANVEVPMNTTEFDQFVRQYGDGIFYLLLGWTGNHDDALDLCQEVFLKSFQRFQKSGALRQPSWASLKTAARWVYCSSLRKRKRESLPVGLDCEKVAEVSRAEEEESQVMSAVRKLPRRYREVIELHCVEGWPLSRIKEEKGISIAAAKARLHRGRLLLAKRLTEFGLG
jgi:RNA polymerase sigma-70 factor (ECF subfamily)